MSRIKAGIDAQSHFANVEVKSYRDERRLDTPYPIALVAGVQYFLAIHARSTFQLVSPSFGFCTGGLDSTDKFAKDYGVRDTTHTITQFVCFLSTKPKVSLESALAQLVVW